MASSQAEMEEWVKFLKRVAGTPSGGKDPCRLYWAEICNISGMGWRQLRIWFYLEQFSEKTTRGQLWGHAHCQASSFPPWVISAGIRNPPVNPGSGAERQFCGLWSAQWGLEEKKWPGWDSQTRECLLQPSWTVSTDYKKSSIVSLTTSHFLNTIFFMVLIRLRWGFYLLKLYYVLFSLPKLSCSLPYCPGLWDCWHFLFSLSSAVGSLHWQGWWMLPNYAPALSQNTVFALWPASATSVVLGSALPQWTAALY